MHRTMSGGPAVETCQFDLTGSRAYIRPLFDSAFPWVAVGCADHWQVL